MDSNPPKHSTSDQYQRLLDLEIKNLLQRVNELSTYQDKIFVEVTSMLLRLEEVLTKMEQGNNRLEFHKQETDTLKKRVSSQELVLKELFERISTLETRVKDLSESL